MEKYLQPFARKIVSILFSPLVKLRINPNLFTLFSLIFAVLAFVYFENRFYLVLFSVLHLICDGIDGFLARELKKETKFGKYFDIFTDRTYEFLMILRFGYEGYLVLLLIFLLYLILNLLNERFFYSRTVIVIGIILGFYELTYYTVFVIYGVGLLLHFKDYFKFGCEIK